MVDTQGAEATVAVRGTTRRRKALSEKQQAVLEVIHCLEAASTEYVISRCQSARFPGRRPKPPQLAWKMMSGHLQLVAAAPDRGRTTRARFPVKVVLADGHAAVRRNLRQLLDREEGLTVVAEAADLSTAARHVHGQLPHVLVLDLEMPDGSSLETIRGLRAEVPETEIVVLTMLLSPALAQ